MRAKLVTRRRNGTMLVAIASKRDLINSPIAKGGNRDTNRGFATCQGLICTPSKTRGKTIGIKMAEASIRTIINPAAKARFPFTICANFGNTGGPAATARIVKPILIGSLTGTKCSSPRTKIGTITRFAIRERMTSRQLRRGSIIWGTVRLKPVASNIARINSKKESRFRKIKSILWK